MIQGRLPLRISNPIKKDWIKHIVPLACVFTATVMLLLTPIWALQWYSTPFLGLLLEPNNVVSKITGPNWPARNQGAVLTDILQKLNGVAVTNPLEVEAFMRQNGFKMVEATFQRATGEIFTLTIQPIPANFTDLFSLFILPYLVGITFLILGIWTYRIRPDLRSARAFATLMAAVSIITTTYLDMLSTHHVILLWGLSLSISGGAVIYLTMVFPIEMKFVQPWRFLSYLPWVVTLTLGAIIAHNMLTPAAPNDYIIYWRWAYVMNALGILALISGLVARMIRSSSAVVRQQSRMIIFGAALAFLPILFLHLIPSGFGGERPEFRAELLFPPFIFFPLSVAYAILRYRLLDVDQWFSRALTYVLTISLTLVVFYAIITGLSFVLSQAIHSDDPMVVTGYLLLLVIGFQPARTLIQRAIDRLFYREKIDFRLALQVFTRTVRHYIDLPELLHVIVYRISTLFHTMHGALYLYRANEGAFQLADAYNLPRAPYTLPVAAEHLERLQTGKIVTQPKNDLFSILIPLIALWADRRELVGVLALGPKLSELAYGHEDISQLTALAGEAGTAISLAQAVSEKHKAIQERNAAEEATQAISANHQAILNNIADGVLVLDPQGGFLSANPALLRMIPKEHLQTIIAEPLGKTIQWKQKAFSVTTAPVPEVGTVAVFRDETRRREMERAKDAMLATASHELRTPLTAVMNYIELMMLLTKMDKIKTTEFGEHLTRALENSKRLQRLIVAILDHAQIQAGGLVLKKQRVNLAAVFEKSRQLLNSLIEHKDLSYEWIIDPDVPTEIVSDPDRLHQILVNLVGNAIKFTDRGGVKVTVSTHAPGTLSITVADTGPGIPPEQLPDIFEAFRRGSDYARREHQGAGLGLSIAKEIVTRMGGSIEVSSEMGVGSIFTIYIPITGTD